jgi:deoxyribonuclease IV
MSMMRLGAHVSTAGGVSKAIENGRDLGCETVQFFGASPRQWAAKGPSDAEAKEFIDARSKSPIKSAYLHASYLVNIASGDELMFARSVKSLVDHLNIAEKLKTDGLIFHMGSGKEILASQAMENIIRGMKSVLKNVPGDAFLIMENSAGGGDKMGYTAKQLGEIYRAVSSPRVKVCFDTAHAFEAGIIETYDKEHIKPFFDEWDRELGLENIVVIHTNDSKTIFNSHHDKHENLGEGYLGLDAFKNLFKDKRLRDRDWILEVPGFEDMGPDKKNMEILRKCAKQ